MADSIVSEVRSMRGEGLFGYGFIIGGSVVVVYATEEEARSARARVVEALASAIRIKAS